MKIEYTPELAEELKEKHGIDAEAELMKILSEELVKEIARERLKSDYDQ